MWPSFGLMRKKEMGRKTRDASLMQRTQATSPSRPRCCGPCTDRMLSDATISNVRHTFLGEQKTRLLEQHTTHSQVRRTKARHAAVHREKRSMRQRQLRGGGQ
jgi:hypothetical protein